MILQKCILSAIDVALVAAIAKEKAEFLGRTLARSMNLQKCILSTKDVALVPALL
jgi:hypothetical protein